MSDRSDAAAAARRLTAHVLDVTIGRPAVAVALALSRFDGETATRLVDTTTDEDGRTGRPLLEGTDLSPGRYELAVAVGDYFAAGGGRGEDDAVDDIPYLDVVPIRFGVGRATGSLHIALLVSPWAYTTYRGS